MEIKLCFTEEQISELLEKHGYVVEDVLMWYPLYDGMDKSSTNFGKRYVKLAYPNGMDCPWKKGEKTFFENYKDFLYDKIVERLISNLVFQKII